MVALQVLTLALAVASLRAASDLQDCDASCWVVGVYHVIDNSLWGEVDGSGIQGQFQCFQGLSPLSQCTMITSDTKTGWVNYLRTKLRENRLAPPPMVGSKRCCSTTVGLYNIHTWGMLSKWPHRADREGLPTDLTMAESEESNYRFQRLFSGSFPHFDGNSTTSPFSTVQRSYFRGWNMSSLLAPRPSEALIPAAAFVASSCHRGESKVQRIAFVRRMQQHMRVDSLGQCIQTKHIPEGVVLRTGATAQESLRMKQEAITRYMFYLAFENSMERGYITEKVFDALIAGVVPVYLGSAEDCRLLMPHPKAAIFVADFDNNPERVATYLTYLMVNRTAYEEHRSWRKSFDASQIPAILAKSWPCRICEWARDRHSQKDSGKQS